MKAVRLFSVVVCSALLLNAANLFAEIKPAAKQAAAPVAAVKATPVVKSMPTAPVTQVKVSGSVAVQMCKNSAPADITPLADSFIRAETKFDLTNSQNVAGLVHLRFEDGMATGVAVAAQLRQGYIQKKGEKNTVTAGRWYEFYTPGTYFGTYLFGVGAFGSGAFLANYDCIDGFKVEMPLSGDKTSLNIALLPATANTWATDYLMARVNTQVSDKLKVNAGINLQIKSLTGVDPVNLFAATAKYKIDEKRCAYGELGICDLSKTSDNTWLMGGYKFPAPLSLDNMSIELEYHKDRIAGSSDADIAWMLQADKAVDGITYSAALGSDPANLGSTKIAEMGIYFRATAAF